jgi:anti-sigma B factor antagonist
MFKIVVDADKTVCLSGRLDAACVDQAKKTFNEIQHSCLVDFSELEYISSAGLGVLLVTQKRLMDKGHKLKLINMTNHVRKVFEYARFDYLFEIE